MMLLGTSARYHRCVCVWCKTLCTDKLQQSTILSAHKTSLRWWSSHCLSCDYTILRGQNKNLNGDKSNEWKTIEVAGGWVASKQRAEARAGEREVACTQQLSMTCVIVPRLFFFFLGTGVVGRNWGWQQEGQIQLFNQEGQIQLFNPSQWEKKQIKDVVSKWEGRLFDVMKKKEIKIMYCCQVLLIIETPALSLCSYTGAKFSSFQKEAPHIPLNCCTWPGLGVQTSSTSKLFEKWLSSPLCISWVKPCAVATPCGLTHCPSSMLFRCTSFEPLATVEV